MTTEERLEKLEREIKEMKALISSCILNGQGQERIKSFVAKDAEGAAVEGKNLDVPTFRRRNIMINP